jgi:hypothetical protein
MALIYNRAHVDDEFTFLLHPHWIPMLRIQGAADRTSALGGSLLLSSRSSGPY